jgi:hypothetical protein
VIKEEHNILNKRTPGNPTSSTGMTTLSWQALSMMSSFGGIGL